MDRFGLAAMLTIGLSGMFVAAWLGAVLTREGRPLGRLVERRFRVIVISLVVAHLACGYFDHFAWVDAVDAVLMILLAMMFMPMLRRLQKSTENEARQTRQAS